MRSLFILSRVQNTPDLTQRDLYVIIGAVKNIVPLVTFDQRSYIFDMLDHAFLIVTSYGGNMVDHFLITIWRFETNAA